MSLQEFDRSRTVWWAFGLTLAAAVLFVVHSFIGTVVFGIFLYYATRPIYRRLKRRVRPASLAAAVAIFALALPALLLVAYALFVAARELDRFTAGPTFDLTRYPGVDQALVNRIADPSALVAGDYEQYLNGRTLTTVTDTLVQASDAVAFFGIGAIHVFVMIALAFYLLRDDHRLSRWVMSRFGDDRGVLEGYLRAVDNDFNSIFFGNILNAILTGTIGVICYSVLNAFAPNPVAIPAPALVGLFAGVASLIPVVGMKLVYVPVAIYLAVLAIAQGQTEALWFVVVFAGMSLVLVDTIPDLVLRPYVSGRSLHVGAVMIAYTFGPLLFGWYGIFLLPMALVLTVQFARLILPELLDGDPIRPYTVDPSNMVEIPVSKEGTHVDVVTNGGEGNDLSDPTAE